MRGNIKQVAEVNLTPALSYKSLPYVEGLTSSLTKVISKINVKLANKNILTLRNLLFSKTKDRTELLNLSNVVYKIPCVDCEGVYIGQSGRKLKDRITSHKSDCKLRPNACGLSEHFNHVGHSIGYDNVEVLCTENNYYKRLFLEMCHISRYTNNLNRKRDVDGLSVIYNCLLNFNYKNNVLNSSHL